MKTQNSLQPASVATKQSFVQRLGLGAFSISLLVHGLFALIAVLFLYKWVYPPEASEPPAMLVPGRSHGGDTTAKINPTLHKAMPVSNSKKGPITIPGISDYALPKSEGDMSATELPAAMPAMLAGQGGGNLGGKGVMGQGNLSGLGVGPIGGKGFMSPFGTNIAIDGTMPGHFYDFKQTAKGKPIENYNVQGPDFINNVLKIQDDGFRSMAFRKFFKAPDSLYLTQLAIPTSNANAGPEFFNVADKVKPSGWLVVYDGTISTTRDMTFRFIGTGDDYISVFSNGRPKMIDAWPDMRQSVQGRWKPSEQIDNEAPSPLPGGALVKGDWITLRRGAKIDVSIAIGERPGGKVGFVLMVEEKGVNYRTASNGAKVLPLFTTQPITQASRERITKDFKNWEFEWENVPVFAVDKTSGMGADF